MSILMEDRGMTTETEVKARAAAHVPVDEVVVVVRGAADDVRIVARQMAQQRRIWFAPLLNGA